MRTVKKLIIYTTIIGAVLFSIMVVFGFIYQDEVVNTVKTEINKQLDAEINVKSIEFSLIPNFPLASVTLNKVVGFESKKYTTKPDTLFKFEAFSLSFNVIDILKNKYILKSISAHSGFIDLKRNLKGIGNYEIIKSDTSSESEFSVDLQSVTLKKCKVGFVDSSTRDRYGFYFHDIIAKGLITDVSVNTALYGSVKVNDLVFDETPYLAGEDAKVDLGVSINLETGAVQVSRGYVTLRDLYQFDAKGKTNQHGFKYTFEAEHVDLKEIETLIPKKHIEFIEAYNISGKANAFVEISRSEIENRPHIFGSFDLKQGNLTFRKTGETVSITEAQGKFDLGKLAQPVTTRIDVSKISLSTKEGSASGSFKLVNLRHPKFVIETKGSVELLEITKLVDFGSDFNMEGLVGFDIKLRGQIQDLDSIQNNDLETFKGTASLGVRNASFKINGAPELTKISAHLDVDKDKVLFTNLNGQVAKSQTTGYGEVKNWLSFLTGKKSALDVHAEIVTENLDMNNWGESGEGSTSNEVSLPDFITYQGRLEVSEFKNGDLQLSNIKTNVQLTSKRLELKGVSLQGFNGGMNADLIWREYKNGHVISGNLITNSVKIDELLRSFNDFGQKELTANQVKGDFNSKLVFGFTTDKKMNIDETTLTMDGDIVILNGELIEHKLLYNIPKELEDNKIIKLFVNMDLFEQRLHHIKFDTMSNHITIKNNTMTLPYMVIHSSAMSIALQGTHTFDNNLDYYVNFSLRHVLGKDEPITNEYGYLVDDDKGNRMIYLHLYTKNGEVEVDLDKFGEDKGLVESTNKEFIEVKSVLKEELGLYKNDTSVVVVEEEVVFDYSVDLGEFSDSASTDSSVVKDTITQDSSVLKKLLKAKKKKKKSEDEDFEEWDFEDDDF